MKKNGLDGSEWSRASKGTDIKAHVQSLIKNILELWLGGQLVGVSFHTPKVGGFDSQAGRAPRLRVQSPVEARTEATDGCFALTSVYLSVCLSSPLSENISLGED